MWSSQNLVHKHVQEIITFTEVRNCSRVLHVAAWTFCLCRRVYIDQYWLQIAIISLWSFCMLSNRWSKPSTHRYSWLVRLTLLSDLFIGDTFSERCVVVFTTLWRCQKAIDHRRAARASASSLPPRPAPPTQPAWDLRPRSNPIVKEATKSFLDARPSSMK